MTSTTYEWEEQPQGMGCLPYLALAALLAVFAFAVISVLGATQLEATQFVPSDHAVEKHGDEALMIRDCMKSNGPFEVWVDQRTENRYFKVCEILPNIFGLQIVYFEKDTEHEITAFVFDDPTLEGTRGYLGKFSKPFNGPLP